MLIIRRSNCINTASVIVLRKWTSSEKVAQWTVTYTENYTRCCINKILPPDDEHSVAWNMLRIIIINVLYNVIVHQAGHFPRITWTILVVIYKLLWKTTNLLNPTMFATCFGLLRPSSSTEVQNLQSKWTRIKGILQFARFNNLLCLTVIYNLLLICFSAKGWIRPQ